ncbi:hypothetical protein DL771_004723 [Monosporascus sp. 5C6A]|nr:hypothetical protein DL771_004723 [Monosporascus sp. 5C6A]
MFFVSSVTPYRKGLIAERHLVLLSMLTPAAVPTREPSEPQPHQWDLKTTRMGHTATEYADLDAPAAGNAGGYKTTSQCIECKDKAKFTIHLKVTKGYAWGHCNHSLNIVTLSMAKSPITIAGLASDLSGSASREALQPAETVDNTGSGGLEEVEVRSVVRSQIPVASKTSSALLINKMAQENAAAAAAREQPTKALLVLHEAGVPPRVMFCSYGNLRRLLVRMLLVGVADGRARADVLAKMGREGMESGPSCQRYPSFHHAVAPTAAEGDEMIPRRVMRRMRWRLRTMWQRVRRTSDVIKQHIIAGDPQEHPVNNNPPLATTLLSPSSGQPFLFPITQPIPVNRLAVVSALPTTAEIRKAFLRRSTPPPRRIRVRGSLPVAPAPPLADVSVSAAAPGHRHGAPNVDGGSAADEGGRKWAERKEGRKGDERGEVEALRKVTTVAATAITVPLPSMAVLCRPGGHRWASRSEKEGKGEKGGKAQRARGFCVLQITKLRHTVSEFLGACGNIEAWAAWNWQMMRDTGRVDFWNHESTSVGLRDAEPYPQKYFMQGGSPRVVFPGKTRGWSSAYLVDHFFPVTPKQLLSTIPRRHRHHGSLTVGGGPGVYQAGAAGIGGSAMDSASSRRDSDSSSKELHLRGADGRLRADVWLRKYSQIPTGIRSDTETFLMADSDTRRTILEQVGKGLWSIASDAPGGGAASEISKAKRFGMIDVKFFRFIESRGADIAPQASRQQSLEPASMPLKGSPSLCHRYADRFFRVQFTEEKSLPPKLFGDSNKASISGRQFPGVLGEHDMTGRYVGRVAPPTATPTTPVANGQLSYHHFYRRSRGASYHQSSYRRAPLGRRDPKGRLWGRAELRTNYYSHLDSLAGLLHIILSRSEPTIRMHASIQMVLVFAAEKQKKDRTKEEDDAQKGKSKPESRTMTRPEA